MTADKKRIILYVVILVPSLLLLSDTLSFGFMSDDYYLVHRIENEGFFLGWGGANGDIFFRPVTVLSYLIDNLIWGVNSVGFHLTNVLWHIICTVLVYLLAVKLLKKNEAALTAGFMFLLLACHSESISWVSGRTDLIATAFCLGSTLSFLTGSWWALPLFATGLLAKESVIITPLLWGLLISKRIDRKSVTITALGLIAVMIYFVTRFFLSEGFPSNLGEFSFVETLENFTRFFFRVFIPPLPLALRPQILRLPIIIPLITTVVVSTMWFLHRKNRKNRNQDSEPLIPVLIGCFFISLLPVINMKVSLFDSQGERFLYLPSVFAAIFLVRWMYLVLSKRTALTILLLIGAFQGAFLFISTQNWKAAGEMCSSIINEVSSGTSHPVEVIDNYRGAYVFRNGFEEALLMNLSSRERNSP